MLAELSFVFSQYTRVTDRRTDGIAIRKTACIQCMRGKNVQQAYSCTNVKFYSGLNTFIDDVKYQQTFRASQPECRRYFDQTPTLTDFDARDLEVQTVNEVK